MVSIAILNESVELQDKSILLAKQLDLPLISKTETFDFLLVYTKEHLELRQPAQKKFHPLYIDFLSQELQYRQRLSSRKNELIARAVGIKSSKQLTVIDATAGFGTDAIILANLGCKITMLERSSIIAALLQDALNRAINSDITYSKRIRLITTDAIQFFKELAQKDLDELPDVIFLDPMFPERKKTALVKKEMRILQELVGKDSDSDELLCLAKHCAKKRVVVKRPKLAPHLAQQTPDIIFRGKTLRYDVYLVGVTK